MPWPGSKVLKKLKTRKADADSGFSLPPPGPSLFKSNTQMQQLTSDTVGRRNVLFRDNKFPDGRSPGQQIVPRPRLSSYSGSLDYFGPQVRSSPATPILPGRMPSTGTAIPSLASYPVSYQSNCYGEYDSMSCRSVGTLQRPRLTGLPDLNRSPEPAPASISGRPPRKTYDGDIPSPDYPILPSSTSSNSNRDSGLDSDSRSSSGAKPPYSPVRRHAEHGQGWNFTNGDQRMRSEQTMFSGGGLPLGNQNVSTQSKLMTLQRNRQRGGFTEDEDMYRSQSNPRHCQYSRPSWDIFETSSVRDWSLPRDRLPLPKTFSLSNVYRASEGRSGTARNRSHDYEASLARAYPGARNGYCNSCSCLEIIRDEIGHYASVGTNTETDSTTETLRSSLKKVQLEKTPLHTKKDRSTRASLVMTWQAMGSDDEGRGDEEEEEEEEEEETNDRRDILSRPAYWAPPLSLPASSPYGRRATGRPPSTSGLRLPRSQPLKVQAHGNTTYRTLDDADQPADTAENEEIKRFEPRRESKETALRSYDFQQTSDFQEYSPSSSTRRILSTEEQEDRTFVRI